MAAAIGANLPVERGGRQHGDRHRRRHNRGRGHLARRDGRLESIRVGGYEMDEAIVDYVKNAHKLLIGQETAEGAKIAVGSAWAIDGGLQERRSPDEISSPGSCGA